MNNIPSILMCAGRQHYKLHEFIQEAENYGVSKRIPLKSIPEGMVNGVSKIFIAHPDAIVKVTADGKTLEDLAYRLMELELLTPVQWEKLVDLGMGYWTGEELKPFDPVPECMLEITYALSQVDGDYSKLVKEFGLQFCMGVIGWSPFQGFQLVIPEGQTEVPADIVEEIGHHIDSGYVQPVHITYTDDDGQDDESEEDDG